MPTRLELAIALFNPDENGVSEWVSVDKFAAAGLNWGNNGNLRRGAPWDLNSYLWEARRGSGRRIEALRMIWINKSQAFNQTIPGNVRKHFENISYCNFSLIPIPQPDREIDHRFGNKNHPDYVKMYGDSAQTVESYQLIHRVLNLQKRQMCVVCIETRRRPPHPILGYAEGDETHADRFPCKGCYLAQPERFRKSETMD